MKKIHQVAMLLLALLFCTQTMAQCKYDTKANKWLYRPGGGVAAARFQPTYPERVDYATRRVKFFDAFVFVGIYSFLQLGDKHFFYLYLTGPASYPYEVTINDPLYFYFSDKQEFELKPASNYLGKTGDQIGIYHIDKNFIDKLYVADLDSMKLTYTPRLNKSPKDESKLSRSFTFRSITKKSQKGFKRHAECIRNEMN